jgi:hypothetical protein
VEDALAARDAGSGDSLLTASADQPLLIVFLRHFGCTFCREALADLAEARQRIESRGTRLVLVHMSSDEDAAAFFAGYGLADVTRVSDPDRELYRAFDLRRGTLRQLFGARVWWRGWRAGVRDGHGVGVLQGDGLQMPGAFLVSRGRIVHACRHESAADRPDYCSLAVGEASALRGDVSRPPAAGSLVG